MHDQIFTKTKEGRRLQYCSLPVAKLGWVGVILAFVLLLFSNTATAQRTQSVFDGSNGGNERLYFLPPVVASNPGFVDAFDASLSPTVEICEWTGTECSATIAVFNFGTGSESVKLNGNHYQLDWNTSKYNLVENQLYRVAVRLNGSILGHFTVKPSSNRETLPVKFHIGEDQGGGIEVPIVTNSSAQMRPDISGNRIVWEDNRNGNWDIYLYDLSTQTEVRITTDPANQRHPAISGNHIVWEDIRNGNGDIYRYDLSTSQEVPVTQNSSDQLNPDVSGDRIVWQDDRNGYLNRDIYMLDLGTGTKKQVTPTQGYQAEPAISGNRIVYTDYHRSNNFDIYMFDLSTNTESQITTNTATQQRAVISENLIAWDDFRDKNLEIYTFDLNLNLENQLTSSPYNQFNPSVSGSQIVWEDNRNGFGNQDIYMFDLSTGSETQITTASGDQQLPSISGNRIVWQDRRNGNWDIYMFDMGSQTTSTHPSSKAKRR